MVKTIQDAAQLFKEIDLKHAAYLAPLNITVIDFIDFHVTPDEIQVIFIKDIDSSVKQTVLTHFREFKS